MFDQKAEPFSPIVQTLLTLALVGVPLTICPSAFSQDPSSLSASGASDTTASMRDPFAPPPPPDSMAVMPVQEAVKLSTQGAFTSISPQAGDSLDYVVTVEWEDTEVPVVVLAPDSVDFPGFKILGQATVHKKLASGNSVRNHTEFIYRLRAQTQGPGKAASMKIRYLTGLSRQEEAVFIPTALTDIRPAPTRLADMLWFKLLTWAVILGGAGALAVLSYKWALRKKSAQASKPVDLKPDVLALKNRLRTAQNTPDASKAILLEMEALAARFLRDEAGAAAAGTTGNAPVTAVPRFDTLLDAHLARKGADESAGGSARDWARLREAFKHARFAGGYKEPHELQEDFRTLRKCLRITGDDQT